MLRQAPPPGPVHLALSGGGIRAALFSAGALVAVAEAEQDTSNLSMLAKRQGADDLNVSSTTAASGSSLLLGRLILQGPKAENQLARLRYLRAETELLWRHGFRRRWPGAFLLSLAISTFLLWAWFLVTRSDVDNQQLVFDDGTPAWALDLFSRFRLWPEVLWIVPLAIVMLLLFRRLAGFTLDIRRGWIAWPLSRLGALWRQQRWNGRNREQPSPLLVPDGPIRLVTTNLSRQAVALWDPWDPPKAGFGQASLHDLVKASAAFPVYSSSVRLDGEPHVDGGVLDNLGVSYGLQQSDGWVLSVDAGLPGDVVVPRPLKASWFRVIAYVVGVAIVATAIGLAARYFLPNEWHDLAATVVAIAIVIAGLRPILGVLFGEVRLTMNEMANEWTALSTMQNQQRDYLYTCLVVAGRPYVKVRLVDGRHFSQPSGRARHDISTKLSPLARDSGREVIREGYRSTCRALGRIECDDTIHWINSLQPSWIQRLGRHLGLPRVARLLRRIFVARL